MVLDLSTSSHYDRAVDVAYNGVSSTADIRYTHSGYYVVAIEVILDSIGETIHTMVIYLKHSIETAQLLDLFDGHHYL